MKKLVDFIKNVMILMGTLVGMGALIWYIKDRLDSLEDHFDAEEWGQAILDILLIGWCCLGVTCYAFIAFVYVLVLMSIGSNEEETVEE